MRKPVVIGAGSGLLVVAFVAGGLWVAENASRTSPVGTLQQNAPATSQRSGMPAAPAMALAASEPRTSHAAQERRRRLAEVRAEFNVLRAQGAKAPPEKMRAMVDELEALSPPVFDPRYFQSLRKMLDTNVRLQALNEELQALTKGAAPNTARREEILAEMRTLGEQVASDARNLQSYAPKPPTAARSP